MANVKVLRWYHWIISSHELIRAMLQDSTAHGRHRDAPARAPLEEGLAALLGVGWGGCSQKSLQQSKLLRVCPAAESNLTWGHFKMSLGSLHAVTEWGEGIKMELNLNHVSLSLAKFWRPSRRLLSKIWKGCQGTVSWGLEGQEGKHCCRLEKRAPECRSVLEEEWTLSCRECENRRCSSNYIVNLAKEVSRQNDEVPTGCFWETTAKHKKHGRNGSELNLEEIQRA